MAPQRPVGVAGGGDAVQDQGAGWLLPVRLCGAQHLQRGAACGSGGVYELAQHPRAAVRAREHLCGERVPGRVPRARAAGLALAHPLHPR
eukprot:997089-Prymnesium_polylepis.3